MNSTISEEVIETFKDDVYRLIEMGNHVPLAVVLEGAVNPNNVLQELADLVRGGTGSRSGVAIDAPRATEESKEAERLCRLYADILGVSLVVEQPGFAHIMRFDPEPDVDTVFV